jgi:hypothetical protein
MPHLGHCRKDLSAFSKSSQPAVSSIVYVFLSDMSRLSKSPYLNLCQPGNVVRDIHGSANTCVETRRVTLTAPISS